MDISLAIDLHNSGEFLKAEKIYLQNLQKNPKSAFLNDALARLYNQIGQFDKAEIYAKNAISIEQNPDYIENLATSYFLQNKLNEAMLLFEDILEKTPQDLQRIRDYASIALDSKQWEFAIKFFSKSIAIDKNDYIALNNMGLAFEALKDNKKAINCYCDSLKIKLNYSAYYNLGVCYRKERNFKKSIFYLKKALKLEPDNIKAKVSLGMSYLSVKDFKNGYRYYIEKRPDIKSEYINPWDGKEHKDSTLLIYFDGGRGDIIMFSRYLPFVKDKFKKIILLVFDEMIEFFKFNFPDIEISSVYQKNKYDYSVNIMNLPYVLNMDFDNIPFLNKYLMADVNKISEFRKKYFNNDELKIGLYWEGNLNVHINRSMKLDELHSLFDLEKCQFYSCQIGNKKNELNEYKNIIDLGVEIKNYSDTAAILKNLDLLITVDTSILHLAGALGVKTFLLLPYASEWRWFEDEKDASWYDSVKIFKQKTSNDWSCPVEKIKKELNKLIEIKNR